MKTPRNAEMIPVITQKANEIMQADHPLVSIPESHVKAVILAIEELSAEIYRARLAKRIHRDFDKIRREKYG